MRNGICPARRVGPEKRVAMLVIYDVKVYI